MVFASTVTGFSAGGAGSFMLAHSSTMLFACAGSISAPTMAAAAIKLRFMNILQDGRLFERMLVGRIMRKQCVFVKAATPYPAC